MFGQQKKAGLAALLVLVLMAWSSPAKDHKDTSVASATDATAPSSVPQQRPIRVEVPLVLVNVSVIDPYNRFVTGLDKGHFEIYEDKEPQKIAHFSTEDVPISIGLLFDASGSMSDKIDKARMAVAQFFRMSNPADEFFLIDFNDRPQLVSEFTLNVADLQNRLSFTEAKGRTSLLDAIYLGLHEMRKAQHARKVILIISDGGDNHSRYSERDIKRAVQESDVQIYAVGIYEPYSSRSRTPEELAGPSLLTQIAESTGGRQFPVENLNDLPDIAAKISRELRNLYVIGYTPSNAKRDGKWRKIQVKLSPPRGLPPLHLFSKSGYYAPQQ
ncbi:MAG: VWA domain-containing protein [Acidobacteria bacterium]|nr:VWA domain-containing protein [Acidobacteriota bacterium]